MDAWLRSTNGRELFSGVLGLQEGGGVLGIGVILVGCEGNHAVKPT